MFKYIVLFFILLSSRVYAVELIDNFKFGMNQVMQSYDKDNGLWDDGDCIKSSACSAKKGFWYWANTMRLVAEYQYTTGDKRYAAELKQTLNKNKADIIGTDYFDDEGWWALAFIAAYDATDDQAYLDAAEDIVADINKRGAQSVCGNGGIYWDRKKTQVGTIANELFISVNAKLYLITQDQKYKQKANETWEWFKNSGLIGEDNAIADHYKINSDGKCGDKVGWNFTYTNGMLFSILADLSKINNDQQLMEQAKQTAERSMYNFTMAGVLTEPCTSVQTCADDAFLFKGIFVHELAYVALNSNDRIFRSAVEQYLADNYSKLVATQGDLVSYAFVWGLPLDKDTDSSQYNPTDLVTQIAALYLMDANLMMNKMQNGVIHHRIHHHVHSAKKQVNRPVNKKKKAQPVNGGK